MEVLRRYSNRPGLGETLHRTRTGLARASSKRHPRRPAGGKRHKVAQRLDEATVAQLVAAYGAGATSTALMQRYCLGRGTVLGLLAAAGVTMRHQGLSEIETGAAAALYARGMSVVSVADRLERPMSTVYLALKRAGVVMRPRQGGRR